MNDTPRKWFGRFDRIAAQVFDPGVAHIARPAQGGLDPRVFGVGYPCHRHDARLIERRSRSDLPPQMPQAILFSTA